MSYKFRSIKGILAVAAAVVLIASVLTASLPAAHAQSGPAVVSPLALGSSFNSQFNGGHAGWSKVSGAWKQTPKYYVTPGIDMAWSSIRHSDTYKNFVYSAKVKRPDSSGTACTYCFVGLITYGNPTPLDPGNRWPYQYLFQYANTGEVQIDLRNGDGVYHNYYPGTINAHVVPFGWNVMKVIMYTSGITTTLLYYINGFYVAGFTDSSPIPPKYVGLGFWNGGGGDKLLVDWAKLSRIVGDLNPFADALVRPAMAHPDGSGLSH